MWTTSVLLSLIALFFYALNKLKRPHRYPPGPQWLPIVGNSPQLKRLSKELGGSHLAMTQWAKDYNTNVLGLRLGSDNVIVIFTEKLIRQALGSEDYDGRPNNFFIRLRTMGTRMGITCTEGKLWADQRNFTVRHLRQVGYGKQAMEDQIREELLELKNALKDQGPNISFGKVLAPSVVNVLWTFTAGKQISRDDARLTKLLALLTKRSKIFDMAGGTLSQMPWLRFIAPEKTGYNLLLNFNKEIHGFFLETISEHHEQHLPGQTDDLIHAYITEMKMNKDPSFTDIQLTMVILDIFIAGGSTTSTTLDLVFLMMLLYPDVQKKAHSELEHVLQGNSPKLEDKSRLPYVEAVLLEVQRFFHIVPMCGPRRVTKDTILDGYLIPEDTTVLLSLHSIHKNNDIWGDPEVFRPERFLDCNGKLVPNDRLIPFGIGKRRCLGEALAKACMFIFFTGVLQDFEIYLPEGSIPPTTDTLPGITLSPKPYTAWIRPRHN